MNKYNISIEVSDLGGMYKANSIEEAQEIAQKLCDDIMEALDGKGSVCIGIESV